MIEIHLYGKLRRFSDDANPASQSVVLVDCQLGDTVGQIVNRLGASRDELGSNIFVNGRYATLDSRIQDGDRLGLFPDDMQLLYKWYFAPTRGSGGPEQSTGDPKSGKEPKK